MSHINDEKRDDEKNGNVKAEKDSKKMMMKSEMMKKMNVL